jgi:predicted ATPase
VDRRLHLLEVENFRSLRTISLPLRNLNVLVGPNGAGKTNVLEVFKFLADVIHTDLEPALEKRNGFDGLVFRGGSRAPGFIEIRFTATWTAHSTVAVPDDYRLLIEHRRGPGGSSVLSRNEDFRFRHPAGGSRRVEIDGGRARVLDVNDAGQGKQEASIGMRSLSSALSTLPRLDEPGSKEVGRLANRIARFRIFDVDVKAARLPSRNTGKSILSEDAGNLSAFLLRLRDQRQDWERLVEDASSVIPNLRDIGFEFPSGAEREVVVVLHENGLRGSTPLADASYGTIRLLGLLALLYDPDPPALTCIEEIDHGLHPQALELLVERLREASDRTQFIIATHSPALADRLKPEELVICERLPDGSSAIPALTLSQVEDIVEASQGLPLGELWFSGALGGDL